MGVGVSASVHAGIPPPWADTPQGADPTTPNQTPPSEHTPTEQTSPSSRHPKEHTPPQEQTSTSPLGAHPQSRHPPGADTPPRDGHCCRRHASYWNAFLFFDFFHNGWCWYSVFLNTKKIGDPNIRGFGNLKFFCMIDVNEMVAIFQFFFIMAHGDIPFPSTLEKLETQTLRGSIFWNFSIQLIFTKWQPFLLAR